MARVTCSATSPARNRSTTATGQRDFFKEKERVWDYGDHFIKDFLEDLNKKDKEEGKPYCLSYYAY
jgi:hypothetical protein